MAQKKEHLKKLLDFIGMIVKDPENNEFTTGLQHLLGVENTPTPVVVNANNEKIDHIYEYCIEEVVRKQAEEFYADFPVKSIVPILIEDFMRMEFCRRKDDFGNFCLHLYQQIECVTNKLCEDPELAEITSKMWGCHAYIREEEGAPIDISTRMDGDFSIANLVFPGKNKKTGYLNSIEKSRSTLQAQYAGDKMRILVYFLGYKTTMRSREYDTYIEYTSLLSDIYQCRNMNHRGNTQNEWELAVLNRIYPLKSFYYFKFMGGLAQYVDYIKRGLPYISELKKYSDSIEKTKVSIPTPKILGKIELKDDGKKRIK